MKVVGSVERRQFRFNDFTDLRTDQAYSYNANVLQLYVTANY
jgi:hypothetical protein